MEKILHSLKTMLPNRNSEIDKLCSLFFHKDEPFVESVFVYGGPSTGKSLTVTTVLEKLYVKYCIVSLVECYTPKILFETILNKLNNHKLDPNNPLPVAKCDIAMDFITHLRNKIAENSENLVIVLDKAEELRNMSCNLLGVFSRVRELSGLPVTVIFISEIVFENYFHSTAKPFKIFFPQYTQNESIKILTLEEEKSREIVNNVYRKKVEFNSQFYQNYLNIFLTVLYRTTRNISELRRMSRINLVKYVKPIVDETNEIEDVIGLWKNISTVLKSSLETLHLMLEIEKPLHSKSQTQDLVAILELPFYAKYLLIAAYLASYNSTKDDKLLFMKFQDKKQRTKTNTRKKIFFKELNVQMGPSTFTIDRLLAIFYSILDKKVGFNNNLLIQVSSLVALNFLFTVSDDSTIDLQKYKCNLTFDFIKDISRIMGINIRKYVYNY